MNRRKLFFNSLLYSSFIFVIIYLYKFDFFNVRFSDFNYLYLVLSIVFLWGGFLLSVVSWHNILGKHKVYISYKEALVSHGLSIFAKYIPGKIWVILGRASKISSLKYSLKVTSYASLKEQILFVWVGLLISILPLLLYRGFDIYSGSVILLFIFISFLSFSDKFRQVVVWGIKKILRKDIEIPHVSFFQSLSTIFFITVYWLAWIFAFYFFAASISPDITLHVGFMFPLSVTLGLLAIIAPGGIGVREGILAGFMILKGIPPETATTISILSRLWFMSGEVFIFFTGLWFKKKNSKNTVIN